eukprot:1175528-Prorocentrum_minimum.AAC.2
MWTHRDCSASVRAATARRSDNSAEVFQEMFLVFLFLTSPVVLQPQTPAELTDRHQSDRKWRREQSPVRISGVHHKQLRSVRAAKRVQVRHSESESEGAQKNKTNKQTKSDVTGKGMDSDKATLGHSICNPAARAFALESASRSPTSSPFYPSARRPFVSCLLDPCEGNKGYQRRD